MLEIKKLSDVPLSVAVRIWNAGFEGYFTDIKMTVDTFTQRLINEGMSPELSVIGYLDGEPAGIVLNGIRTEGDMKIAWNGGTGIAAPLRGQGIGRQMMQAVLEIYEREGAALATLEAIGENKPAIGLYESLGYEVKDRLLFLQKSAPIAADSFGTDGAYTLTKAPASRAAGLDILNNRKPWQTKWQSLHQNGELAVVSDEKGPLAYFLYRESYDESHNLAGVTLFHADVAPKHDNVEAAVRYGLGQVLKPELDIKRGTYNLPESCTAVIKVLEEAGFESPLDQVYMEKSL